MKCITSDTTRSTRKTKNRICAMLAEAPAMPPNPSRPAMIAMTRKVKAQPSMTISFGFKSSAKERPRTHKFGNSRAGYLTAAGYA